MLFRKLNLFKFAIKKQLKRPGIIIEPEAFRQLGFVGKTLNWWKNSQTLGDMERHLSDFRRTKSHLTFVHLNNSLVESIEKKNLRDIQMLVGDDFFKQIKSNLKNNEPLPINYNLFQAKQGKIVQARSFTQTLIRLKSIDQWYQVTVEFQNPSKKLKAYHVIERFYKQKQWKFIKFNL